MPQEGALNSYSVFRRINNSLCIPNLGELLSILLCLLLALLTYLEIFFNQKSIILCVILNSYLSEMLLTLVNSIPNSVVY